MSALLALASPRLAYAEGFAQPPGSRFSAAPGDDEPPREPEDSWAPKPSLVRLHAGPAAKLDAAGAAAGLLVAAEIGRGPTGGRLTACWLDVAVDRGISQYTAELSIDFGGRSRFRPVVGAGGGIARTSTSVAADGSVDASSGASIGIGIARLGLGFRLPFEQADARVALDVTGTLPAIRAESAPDLSPWVVASLTVGAGF